MLGQVCLADTRVVVANQHQLVVALKPLLAAVPKPHLAVAVEKADVLVKLPHLVVVVEKVARPAVVKPRWSPRP